MFCRKLALALGMAVSALSAGAAAAPYPAEPVRLVVPYAPGGTTDLLARLIASKLSAKYERQVVVENKTGAGGNIAAGFLARSRPDGYTLMMASIGQFAINPLIFSAPGYDAAKDFQPVIQVTRVPNVLVVNAASKLDSLQDLIKLAQAQPGVTYASSGNGSSNHLAGALLAHMANIDMLHIPYKGSAPGLQALYGGDVQVMFDNLSSALPHVQGGKLRALRVSSETRFSKLPDVPTIAESGLPGYEASAWFGLVAPAGTPAAIVEQLNRDVAAVLADNDVRSKLLEMGMTPQGGSVAQFQAVIDADIQKWKPIVQSLNLAVN